MTKYILDVTRGQANTAGVKAKEDITEILVKDGFKKLVFQVRENKFLKLIMTRFDWGKSLSKAVDGDTIVFQYPMYSRFAGKSFFEIVNKRNLNINKIVIIHDIESLRLYKDNKKAVKEELDFLNKFDCLVVHNSKMKGWLAQNGITKKMVELKVFDYINNNKLGNTSIEKPIIFAGNLEKSKFLEKLDIKKEIDLFGIMPSENYPKNIRYNGVKSPEELSSFFDGSFGLVWDGNSIETNNGIYGEYTRYNNPHKVSLYISSGLPVIVWKEAAIAEFVRSQHIGIIVSSLDDIDNILAEITSDEYSEMVKNVDNESDKLRMGYYTKLALSKGL